MGNNTTLAIYSITSGLHDEAAVKAISDEFLGSVFGNELYIWKGADFSDFGTGDLNIIYIRTGGAEGIFKSLLPEMLEAGTDFFTLLASGKSNSLAASLEILSYLRQNGLKGEVLHGSPVFIRKRIEMLKQIAAARATLNGAAIGVIGKPSDWLIASGYDAEAIQEKLGIATQEIPMEEVLERTTAEEGLSGAIQIYQALKDIISSHGLGALTLRCFDLLGTVHNTGCYALAQLNSEGIPSSCEGDVPALLSMMVAQALTGRTGFQANPARIDTETGEMLFAHCTIPFNMVDDFCYDTHSESGIGVGIHGHFPEGPVTVFKLSGSLDRAFIAEGELFRNQKEPDLCRTQVWLRLRPEDARYFLTNPIGNHHILLPGHHGAQLREFVGGALDIDYQ